MFEEKIVLLGKFEGGPYVNSARHVDAMKRDAAKTVVICCKAIEALCNASRHDLLSSRLGSVVRGFELLLPSN